MATIEVVTNIESALSRLKSTLDTYENAKSGFWEGDSATCATNMYDCIIDDINSIENLMINLKSALGYGDTLAELKSELKTINGKINNWSEESGYDLSELTKSKSNIESNISKKLSEARRYLTIG